MKSPSPGRLAPVVAAAVALTCHLLVGQTPAPRVGHLLNLNAAVAASDCIAVGRLVSLDAVAPNRSVAQGHFAVDQRIHGCPDTAYLDIEFTRSLTPGEMNRQRLVMLKSENGGSFRPVGDASLELLPADVLPSDQPVGDPQVAVEDAVGLALMQPGTQGREEFDALNALASNMPDGSNWIGRSVIAMGALLKEVSSPDEYLSSHAIYALVSSNCLVGLSAAREYLSHDDNDPTFRRSVTSAISHFRSSDGIPDLESISHSSYLTIRRAALEALANTGSMKAVPILGGYLDDGDFDVRHLAVSGLGKITGQKEWVLSATAFREREQSAIGYWKQWISRTATGGKS